MLRVNAFLDSLIFLSKLLSVKDHLVDLLFSESALVVGDRNVLLFASSFLDSANGENGVFINLESYFDLRDTSLGGWNTRQIELTELMVVLNQGTFSFKDGNGDSGLLVLISGEGLRFLGGNNGTTLDN